MPESDKTKSLAPRRPDWQPMEITGLGEHERDDMYLDWVRQEDPEGCFVSVLAMLTDDTYANVRAAIEREQDPQDNWRRRGLTQSHAEKYLAERGWFLRRVYARYEFGAWPPPPFADRHYAIVANPGGGHCVAMDYFGRVLDPLREGFFNITDWDVVNCVVGITRRVSTTGEQR